MRGAGRAASQGDVAAAARLLLERLRAGSITREALELAAYCGHAAAREVVQSAQPPAKASAWIMGLDAFQRPTWARAVTWIAELALDRPAEVGNADTTSAQETAVRATARSIHSYLDRPDAAALVRISAELEAVEGLLPEPQYHVARSLLLFDAFPALTGHEPGHFLSIYCEAENPEALAAHELIATHLRARFLASLGLDGAPPV